MPFPEHGILHFRGRSADWMMAVHHRQAVNIPCQPADGEAEYDDEKQRPVGVGETLYFGHCLVDTCRFGEASPGIHVAFVALLVFRVVFVRHLLAEQHTSESFDIPRAGRENTVTADLQIFIPAISPHGRAVQRLLMSVRLIFQKIFTAMI